MTAKGNRSILTAFVIAVLLHAVAVFFRMPFHDPSVSIRKTSQRRLEISFVSAYKEDSRPVRVKKAVPKKMKPKAVKKRVINKAPALRKKTVKEEPPAESRKAFSEAASKTAPEETADSAPVEQGPPQDDVIVPAVPSYRSNPPPRYPAVARRRGYEGVVMLSVKVMRDGIVGDICVKNGCGHAILDKAALRSVKKWRFEPATRRGVPVDMWVDVPVRFLIKDRQ